MKLSTVQIREFKSIWDSNRFETANVTCLVGKNEAGKTAVLQALYRLNPIIPADARFDVTDDYPRSEVEDYQQDVESGRRHPAVVVQASFELEDAELAAISNEYGDGVIQGPVHLSRGYQHAKDGNTVLDVELLIDESRLVKNLVNEYELPTVLAAEAVKHDKLASLIEFLEKEANRQSTEYTEAQENARRLEEEGERAVALENAKTLAESEQSKTLRARLAALAKHESLSLHIWNTHLQPAFPKFLYFDEYYQMRGHDNIEELKQRQANGQLLKSDHPLLGLIELARLDLDQLLSTQRTQVLKNKLQGASNHLSAQILKYWSQNKHLRMMFDVRPGLTGDPEGMKKGTNIWGEVYDSKHLVSTGLGTRSAGFVWFFSFLAWYSAVKKKDEALVLLLDEPGLSLHGRAQQDLLDYFEAEIASNPKHQLLYTTHSPFMVDSQRFDRVRIVQDKSIDTDAQLPRSEDGTKVFVDVLEAGPDSLFPLQGALGYEIYQTLFVGPNCLIVEGVSDLLFIQTISGVLDAAGRTGLDPRWTITPVGGSDKVPTFVSLIGSQKNLRVATLIDFQKSDAQMIENLYKRKLLKKKHVLTFADFVGAAEADIEDMFDETLYLDVVNAEYAKALTATIGAADLGSRSPRIVVRLEEHFQNVPLKHGEQFNHYRPARYFAENASTFNISPGSLDRFEKAFTALNGLL